uniref:Zinc finger LSD1-type domain-containing protein n=1 Tax=Salix viminalis TaxID=40686 RepID=A0A6N2KKW7_SALVM
MYGNKISGSNCNLAGMDMAQLICRGCRSLLMYPHGATSVRCSCCHAVNLAPARSCQLWELLDYSYVSNGSPSVKCPVCQYVTNMANMRVPLPANRPNGTSGTPPSTSMTQTVVVENLMSVDESGKLVSNVVVGVTTDKKIPR